MYASATAGAHDAQSAGNAQCDASTSTSAGTTGIARVGVVDARRRGTDDWTIRCCLLGPNDGDNVERETGAATRAREDARAVCARRASGDARATRPTTDMRDDA